MPQPMEPEPYNVTCQACRKQFDAGQAEWCSCLHKERTFSCPHCGLCFCDAPAGYKKRFWEEAPQSMWDRKMKERKSDNSFLNPSPSDVRRPLVLLVDDEPEIRAVAIRVIESLGYGLIVAKDGQEGLSLAAQYEPQLVLTDAMMPKLDGREMGRLIKANPRLTATKVVVMTSLYTDARYKYEALKDFRADEYLTKPLAVEKLEAVLQRHLGRA